MPDDDVRLKLSRREALTAAITVFVVGAVIAGAYFLREWSALDRKAIESAAIAVPWPQAGNGTSFAPTQPPQKPAQAWIDEPPASVAEAFALAFQGGNPAQVKIEGFDYQFSPVRITDAPGLISVGDRQVLVSMGWWAGASHGASGYMTIHYFEKATPLRLTGGWRVPTGAWGMPPEIVLDTALLPFPAVQALGGATGQGCVDEAPVIVELRPDGPVFATVVAGSGTIEGSHPYNLESKLTRADGGFDVQYRDADSRKLRYRRTNGKFVTRDSLAGLPVCSAYENVVEQLK